jgi:Fe-S oxidoreductase
MSADTALLRAAGLEVDAPDTGCCGMAGSFGFRRETEAASRRIAELALLPRLRAAGPDTRVVVDGFSCREQIESLSGRLTQHLAEVLAGALE